MQRIDNKLFFVFSYFSRHHKMTITLIGCIKKQNKINE